MTGQDPFAARPEGRADIRGAGRARPCPGPKNRRVRGFSAEAFPDHDIETRNDNHRCAEAGGLIRRFLEKQKTEGRAPDDLAVLHRRDDGRIGKAVGRDDAQTGREPEEGHHRQKPQMFDRQGLVDEGQEAGHEDDIRHHRIEHQDSAPLRAADLAGDDGDDGAPHGCGETRDMSKGQRFGPGSQHDQHTDQAKNNRRPAMHTDLFPEDRDGQDRDDQRSREDKSIDLRQWQDRKRIERRASRDDARHGAHRDPTRVRRPQRPLGGIAHQHERREGETQQDAEKQDLKGGVIAAQELDDNVMR